MSFSVKSKQYMRTIRRFSAVLIGIVFFVSGMLKLMDPVGTSLIVEEYLKFFRLGFLHFADYALGACLALAETILGDFASFIRLLSVSASISGSPSITAKGRK